VTAPAVFAIPVFFGIIVVGSRGVWSRSIFSPADLGAFCSYGTPADLWPVAVAMLRPAQRPGLIALQLPVIRLLSGVFPTETPIREQAKLRLRRELGTPPSVP